MSTYDLDISMGVAADITMAGLRISSGSDLFFERLSATFPVLGSGIDWSRIANSVCRSVPMEAAEAVAFSQFFQEMRATYGLFGTVTYAGDSLTEVIVTGEIDQMSHFLALVTDIPQHHYFVGEGFSWCMNFSMEGDMRFALAPESGRA